MYVAPNFELVLFAVEDVMTASVGGGGCDADCSTYECDDLGII